MRRITRNSAKHRAAVRCGDEKKADKYLRLVRSARQDVITAAIAEVRRDDLAAAGAGREEVDPETMPRRPLLTRLTQALSRLRIILPEWVVMHTPTKDEDTRRTRLRATWIDHKAKQRDVEVEAEEETEETAVVAAMLKAIDAELSRYGADASTLTSAQLALVREHRSQLSELAEMTLFSLDLEDEYQDRLKTRKAHIAARFPLSRPPSSASALTEAEVTRTLKDRPRDRGPKWGPCQVFDLTDLIACCDADQGAILTTTTTLTQAPVTVRLPRLVPGGITGVVGDGHIIFVPLEEIGSLHPDGDVESAKQLADGDPEVDLT